MNFWWLIDLWQLKLLKSLLLWNFNWILFEIVQEEQPYDWNHPKDDNHMKKYAKLHIVKDVMVVFGEAFSIHPSVRPIIHPWMASYMEENLGRNK